MRKLHRHRLNQKGLITLDFIFALLMVFAFSAVLFGITFSLSIAEVVQYISFASARNYFAAHVSQEKQKEMAELKFDQLKKKAPFASLFAGNWFEIGDVQIGDFTSEYPAGEFPDRNAFIGARIPYNAKLLEMRFPLLGSTATEDNGFVANISSYLMREPSTQECMDFNRDRMEAIKTLLNYSSGNIQADQYVVIADNGC